MKLRKRRCCPARTVSFGKDLLISCMDLGKPLLTILPDFADRLPLHTPKAKLVEASFINTTDVISITSRFLKVNVVAKEWLGALFNRFQCML